MRSQATQADPAANRLGFRPAANDGKANPFELRRRSGHPWPFISTAANLVSSEVLTHSEINDSAS